ncbi:MAG: hypothetical protein P8H45_06500 [Flavobacteriaceae bacterium]|nr:hypothetical protein [Flavobacteriaceae bacterium]
MLDAYFKKPVFWDFLIAIIVMAIIAFLNFKQLFNLPKDVYSLDMASDLSNVSLTSVGFVLTLLTVLITFKSGSNLTKEKATESNTLFELFFTSPLYFETVKHLKNCIKSLIVIAILGFSLKLGLTKDFTEYIFFFNIIGLIIIVMTLWRCLLILSSEL